MDWGTAFLKGLEMFITSGGLIGGIVFILLCIVIFVIYRMSQDTRELTKELRIQREGELICDTKINDIHSDIRDMKPAIARIDLQTATCFKSKN